MLAEILTIGDELCRGEIVDTNSAWLAAQLWDLDITVGWMTSCRDREDDMRSAFELATGRADLVLVSGGLGPTLDDITVDVVAALAGVEAEVHEPSKTRMEKRFETAKYKLTPNNLRQVRAPRGARVFVNPAGQAPGFEALVNGVPVMCMPGIPREMKAIFTGSLVERITTQREARGDAIERIARRIFRVFGRGESHIATALDGVTRGVKGASLHFQVKFPETLVKVVVRDRDQAAADARLAELDTDIRSRLGISLYGVDDDSLPDAVARALIAAGATVSTAESCTGGLIGGLLTRVAGSSAYFTGGAITYSNAEKVRQLGVRDETLEAHGAVSEQCVGEMAEGARERFGTDYAVAVSGIAGPGGARPQKPVGTVWLAVAGGGEPTRTKLFTWPGARDQIRQLAAHWALALLLARVNAAPQRPREEPNE